MNARVRMTNGDSYTIHHLPDEDALDLAEDLESGDGPTLTLVLDPPRWRFWNQSETTVHLMRHGVSSVELT